MYVVKCKYKPGQKVFRLEGVAAIPDEIVSVKIQSNAKETAVLYELSKEKELAEDQIFETTRDISIHLGFTKPIVRNRKEVAQPSDPDNEPETEQQ